MRLAILSDIHANLEALHACLEHAGRERAGEFVFPGDLVGYGADPVPCLETVQAYAARGALVLRGNHDEAAGVVGPSNCKATGWAVDPNDRSTRLAIRILADGSQIAAGAVLILIPPYHFPHQILSGTAHP